MTQLAVANVAKVLLKIIAPMPSLPFPVVCGEGRGSGPHEVIYGLHPGRPPRLRLRPRHGGAPRIPSAGHRGGGGRRGRRDRSVVAVLGRAGGERRGGGERHGSARHRR